LACDIKRLSSLFQQFDFEHVYKEPNKEADDLSKIGLNMEDFSFILEEFTNG